MYVFLPKKIGYTGFMINKNGTHLNPKKINATNELSEPKDLRSYKAFLEVLIIIQIYSKYCKNWRIALEFNSKRHWKENNCNWTIIIWNLKQVLLIPAVLTIYDQNLLLKLDCDASP